MKAIELAEAIGQISDRFILEVIPDPTAQRTNNRTHPHKIIRTIMLVAAIVAALTCTVFAASRLINSPDNAWRVVQQEISKMQDMGILSEDILLADTPTSIVESPEEQLDKYWFDRLLHHRYSIVSKTQRHTVYTEVDTTNGRIYKFTIEAYADESDVPVRSETLPDGATLYYYTNYEDIFSADMTVDRFCSLLAEYWGYSGYTLAGTKDSDYGYDTQAPAGDKKLVELSEDAYLTIYFDGDQKNTPMYVQLAQFPGWVSLSVGTRHFVG